MNVCSPAQSPEWWSSLQVSLPHGTSLLWGWGRQHWGPGLSPEVQLLLELVLQLVGFVWMKWEQSAYFGLVLCLFPPRWVYLVSRPEERMSLRAAELTQRHNWALGCTPRRRWGECECEYVSSCGACRSSWSCVWRRRWRGPETRASCSSLRWSALQILPGGQTRSLTYENRRELPDGPLTHCQPHARHLPRFDLPAFASSAAPAECSAPGEGTEERKRDMLVHHSCYTRYCD